MEKNMELDLLALFNECAKALVILNRKTKIATTRYVKTIIYQIFFKVFKISFKYNNIKI